MGSWHRPFLLGVHALTLQCLYQTGSSPVSRRLLENAGATFVSFRRFVVTGRAESHEHAVNDEDDPDGFEETREVMTGEKDVCQDVQRLAHDELTGKRDRQEPGRIVPQPGGALGSVEAQRPAGAYEGIQGTVTAGYRERRRGESETCCHEQRG